MSHAAKSQPDKMLSNRRTRFAKSGFSSRCNEVMEVLSSAIIKIQVRSHNQGLLINHQCLNSNYQTVILEWDGYGAKLPTKDSLRSRN